MIIVALSSYNKCLYCTVSHGAMLRLSFYFKEYFYRVKINNDKLHHIDDGVYYFDRCVTLSKHVDAFKNPYSIYQHRCTNCGAPVKNTTDITCGFCDTQLNNTHADWVITGVFKVAQS